jgi:hypothetical protein
MMFLYPGAALGLALVYPWSREATALRLAPALLGVVVTLGQAKWQERFMSPTVLPVQRTWTPLGKKLRDIPDIISPATETPRPLCDVEPLRADDRRALLDARSRAARRRHGGRRDAGPRSRAIGAPRVLVGALRGRV